MVNIYALYMINITSNKGFYIYSKKSNEKSHQFHNELEIFVSNVRVHL